MQAWDQVGSPDQNLCLDPMRIVINADDFGHSADTVRATIDCFERGIVTSASIMPRMPATSAALQFAAAHPELSFGVHLTFVGDGTERPVADASEVEHLVDEDGRFLPTNRIRMRALTRRLPMRELEREVAAQIDAVLEGGVTVSHVDSHRHLHKYGPFRAALERVLPRYGIRRVRTVQDVYLRRPWKSPTFWIGPAWRHKLRRSFVTTDHFYMGTSAGDRTWDGLGTLVAAFPQDRTLEIGMHPGYEEPWREAERIALADFVASIHGAHALVGWSDLRVPS